jgi:hypothetical protein
MIYFGSAGKTMAPPSLPNGLRALVDWFRAANYLRLLSDFSASVVCLSRLGG